MRHMSFIPFLSWIGEQLVGEGTSQSEREPDVLMDPCFYRRESL